MKNRLLVFLIVFPFILSLSSNVKCKEVRYTLSGKMEQTNAYYGGAENPYPPQSYPLVDYTLCVVQLRSDQKPKFVGKVTGNDRGEFSIELPPGLYGFVNSKDLHSLEVGQFIPTMEQSGDINDRKTSSWTITDYKAVEIVDTAVSGIVITNNKSTSCGLCP